MDNEVLIKTTKFNGFIVHGSTGCSCCRNENFVSGIYDDEDSAMENAIYHQKQRTVRSQYSDTGIYSVIQLEYELFEDGRILIGRRVFDDKSFWESGEIAEDLRYDGKVIISTK